MNLLPMNLTVQIHYNVLHFIGFDNNPPIVYNYYIHLNSHFIHTNNHSFVIKNYLVNFCLYQYFIQFTSIHDLFINMYFGHCSKNSFNEKLHSYHFSHLHYLIYYACCLRFFLKSLFYYLSKKIHDFKGLQKDLYLLYFV